MVISDEPARGERRILKLPDSQILKTALPLSLVAAVAVLARKIYGPLDGDFFERAIWRQVAIGDS